MKQRLIFLQQAEKTIDEFLQEQPCINLQELEAVLGTPSELAQTYLNSLDASVLLAYRKRQKRIFALLVVALLLAVIIIGVFVRQKWMDEHPVFEYTTTITEYS